MWDSNGEIASLSRAHDLEEGGAKKTNEFSEVEESLRKLLRDVAMKVPDEPDGSRLASIKSQVRIATSSTISDRRARRRTIVIATAAGVAALGGGAGIAAAGGWLPGEAPAPPNYLGSAQAILGSPNPERVKGATVEIQASGPDLTAVSVVSARGADNRFHTGECVELAITLPNGSPVPGTSISNGGACTVISNPIFGLRKKQQRPAFGTTSAQWTNSRGASYTFVFGETGQDVRQVALVDQHGRLSATGVVRRGWFVVYEPAENYSRFHRLRFLR